uniref:Uncharacterized protein n=1 Tax=Rhizophora mucronata TaxID=61149 RepID=A0A2P2P0C0_RHIMU
MQQCLALAFRRTSALHLEILRTSHKVLSLSFLVTCLNTTRVSKPGNAPVCLLSKPIDTHKPSKLK